MSIPNSILMVRPAAFSFNPETAETNVFQSKQLRPDVQKKAIDEFDGMTETLKNSGIEVHVYQDTKKPVKPDAVFSNNWLSTHENGTVVLYPMLTENRKLEVRTDILDDLSKSYKINCIVDLRDENQKALEGTGSIIFDHENKQAFASESSRTNLNLYETLCKQLRYKNYSFSATDIKGKPYYHTNIIMSIGSRFTILCSESIENMLEKAMITEAVKQHGHTLIEISRKQAASFCGNIIELKGENGPVIVMSETAFKHFDKAQIQEFELHGKIVKVNIPTIESIGGGSARCMITGIYLKKLN